ncbi:hypothetical protein PR048_019060 [Dryococelus australis]|uniref:Uncharacterized protein n=1 Tax=Dryococelus australis TaxID=614101 RepID=A0ABQ9H2J7_9NEOP|nr:hypothetical protein PR048_019060 [Dryococelus australis]
MAGLKVSEIITILSGVVCVMKLKTSIHRLGEWKQKLASLIQAYQPRDVFNGDETGPFLEVYQQEPYLRAKRSVLEYNGSLTKKTLDDCCRYGGVASWFQHENKKPKQEGLAFFGHHHIKLSNVSHTLPWEHNIDNPAHGSWCNIHSQMFTQEESSTASSYRY